MKMILFLTLILGGLPTRAQTALPSKSFYAYEYICHVIGGTAKDYVLLLYPDSTVTFSVYTQKTGNYARREQSTEFRQTGKYVLNGDTLTISYKPVSNINNSTRTCDENTSLTPIASHLTTQHFLLDTIHKRLLSFGYSTPQLESTSLPEINQKLAKRNRWQISLKHLEVL